MEGAKWVKIATAIYKDDKVSVLDNEYILLWVYLIARAGEINDNGKVYITEAVPYTEAQLAKIFRMSKTTISKGLEALSQLQLISVDDGMISICNWDKHQNVNGLDALREYNREAKRKSREMSRTSQGQIKDKNAECQGQMSMTNQEKSEKEKRTKREKEKKEIENIDIRELEGEQARPTRTQARYIKPTLDEVKAYVSERGNKIDAEKFYDYYESNGWKVGKNPMKDWKAAVRLWESKEKEVSWYKPRDQMKRESSFDTDDFFRAAVAASYKE